MLTVRLKVSMLHGTASRNVGDVIEADDHRARHLVELGHAEYVTQLALAPEPQKATGPRGAQKAVARS